MRSDFEYIKSVKHFKEVLGYCKQTKDFCFDFETSAEAWYLERSYATILSISCQPGYGYVLPINHYDTTFTQEEITIMFELLQTMIWDDDSIDKTAHNLIFDMHWMYNYGIRRFKGRLNDTMLMSHILFDYREHGLKPLVDTYFPEFKAYGLKLKIHEWKTIDLETLSKYASLDTDLTLRLKIQFTAELLKDERLYLLYRNYALFALPTIFMIERRGCRVDSKIIIKSLKKGRKLQAKKLREFLDQPIIKRFILRERELANENNILDRCKKIKATKAKFKAVIKVAKKENKTLAPALAERKRTKNWGNHHTIRWAKEIADIKAGVIDFSKELNLNSPIQMKRLFYHSKFGFKFKPRIHFMTHEKEYTLDKDYLWLLDLEKKGGIIAVQKFMAWKSITKMLSTYYEGILKKITPAGLVHARYSLHGTRTGRISAKDPNLQNIPWHTKLKDEDVRWVIGQVKTFFPVIDKNHMMLQVDYAQAELRFIANLTLDKTLIDAFKTNKDVHSISAARMRGMKLKDFLKGKDKDPYLFASQRAYGKHMNFSLLYKISKQGYISYIKRRADLVIDEATADIHIAAMFSTYKGLKPWHALYEAKVRKYGYVRTLFGRKRHLPEIWAVDQMSATAKRDKDKLKEAKRKSNKAIRDAINSPIQGGSGEWCIFGLVLLQLRLPDGINIFNTIHDSKFIHMPKTEYDYCIPIIDETCANLPVTEYFDIPKSALTVPMAVDYEISDTNWKEMVDANEYFEKQKSN